MFNFDQKYSGYVSIGEVIEARGGKTMPKSFGHFVFKEVTPRIKSTNYPRINREEFLEIMTPRDGRTRLPVKRIRIELAANLNKALNVTFGEYSASGLKWYVEDPMAIQFDENDEPILESVMERQSDRSYEEVQFQPNKHLATHREKNIPLRSTNIHGYLWGEVGGKWVRDPLNWYWRFHSGSEVTYRSLCQAINALRGQAVGELFAACTRKTISDVVKMPLQDLVPLLPLIEKAPMIGRSIEFSIGSGISQKTSYKYFFVQASAQLDPNILGLMRRIEMTETIRETMGKNILTPGEEVQAIETGEVLDAEPVFNDEEEEDLDRYR